MAKNKRILCISDLHIPYQHRDAFKFLDAVNEKYKPDSHVCLGDEIDGNTISFHDKDPDLPFSPSSELKQSIYELKDLYAIFPRMNVIDSNHGSLIFRKAKIASIPLSVFRPWSEVLEAPKGWKWTYDLTLKMSNGKHVYFHHGLSNNALRCSQNKSMSYVQGHYHTKFEIMYWANSIDLFWGVTSGCLIDHKSLAFAYAKNTLPKPILGCTMIIEGHPVLIPMVINDKHRWIGKLP